MFSTTLIKNKKIAVQDHELNFKAAMTDSALERNAYLRKAVEMVKSQFPNGAVLPNFAKDRNIKLDGDIVFEQQKSLPGGTWMGVCSNLKSIDNIMTKK